MSSPVKKKGPIAATNPCSLCAPLGASLAFKGIEKCIPLLHGSQGCATYIRRYMISHFREPIDIASSSFDEKTVIFGGRDNLLQALDNIESRYDPDFIGIATSCLSETIGDDPRLYLNEWKDRTPLSLVSTASYKGSHWSGFHDAVLSMVISLAGKAEDEDRCRGKLMVAPGFLSPADYRNLKRIIELFDIDYTLLPDYSETLDGGPWGEYHAIPQGGTPVRELEKLHCSERSLELGGPLGFRKTAGTVLYEKYKVPLTRQALPLGVEACDNLVRFLSSFSGKAVSLELQKERGRLVDAYADAHKYIYGKRVLVYGHEDMAAALAVFLAETGAVPVFVGTGGQGGCLQRYFETLDNDALRDAEVQEDIDFSRIDEAIERLKPDFVVGTGKGYKATRKAGIPLIRTGFPIHDRFGGQRLLHSGYNGTLELFDRIINALLEYKQETSPVAYTYQ